MRSDKNTDTKLISSDLPEAFFYGAEQFIRSVEQTCLYFFKRSSSSLLNQAEMIKNLGRFDFEFSNYTCLVYLQAIFSGSKNKLQEHIAEKLISRKVIISEQNLSDKTKLVKIHIKQMVDEMSSENGVDFWKKFKKDVKIVKGWLNVNHQRFDINKIHTPLNNSFYEFFKGASQAEKSIGDSKLEALVKHSLFDKQNMIKLLQEMLGSEKIIEEGIRLIRE